MAEPAPPDVPPPRSGRRWMRGLLSSPLGMLLALSLGWYYGPTVGWLAAPICVFGAIFEFSEPKKQRDDLKPKSASPMLAATTSDKLALAIDGLAGRDGHGAWKIPVYSVLGLIVIVAGANTLGSLLPSLGPIDLTPRWWSKILSVEEPKTLEARVGARNVERAGNWVLISYHTGTVWSPKRVVINAGNELASLGRWAAINVRQRLSAEKVIYRIYMPTRDEYGNSSSSLVMIWEIDPAVFGKINWSNFSGDMLLNHVEIQQLWPVIVPGVVEYCQDESRAMFARTFCQNAVRFMPR